MPTVTKVENDNFPDGIECRPNSQPRCQNLKNQIQLTTTSPWNGITAYDSLARRSTRKKMLVCQWHADHYLASRYDRPLTKSGRAGKDCPLFSAVHLLCSSHGMGITRLGGRTRISGTVKPNTSSWVTLSINRLRLGVSNARTRKLKIKYI